MDKTYLIVVDAHSKWPEIVEMNLTTAQKTITELCKMFAAYGLPTQLVSDNGPQFMSDEFADLMQVNGIKHIRCGPYHPASSGDVEQLVQTFKNTLKSAKNVYPKQTLVNFLLIYHSTHHSITNETPSNQFIGYKIAQGLIYFYLTRRG